MAELDRYTHGHHRAVVAQHAKRTLERDAAYLIPYLRSGQRVLDVGCGPGSITRGLARRVAPGDTLGIDLASDVLAGARDRARADLHAPRFETADVYGLPYEDSSFDVVHAHQVLQHLEHPVRALHELRRVLAPSGVIGVRDGDYASMQSWPVVSGIERWRELYHDVARHNGAEPDAGRVLPHWLREAGFDEIEVSADTVCFHRAEDIRNLGESWAERVLHSNLGRHAIEHRLSNAEELESIAAAWRSFGRTPGALFFYVNVACVARRTPGH